MDCSEILKRLESLSDPKAVEGMARFGIKGKKVYGISIPVLRGMAKEIGKDHTLAAKLWSVASRETRILASMIDDPEFVSEAQMDLWVEDFDSWEVCDQCCMGLFDKTAFAYEKAVEWSRKNEEFVKRAGFALMAGLAFHDKKASDESFEMFFPEIKRGSVDDRNFVRKSVNWALRQIGKRNKNLCKKAVQLAEEIHRLDSKSAKWVASDALRELSAKKF